MKQWMIGAVVLTMISLGVAAQEQRKISSPEDRAQRMTERMASELKLSEEQKQKVLAINLEHAKNRAAEMEKQRAEMEARKAEMKAQEEKIKEVLTEEQRKQWEQIKMDRKSERRPGGMIEDRRDFESRQRPHRGGRR
jgi:Spy/CpxP family protein refolding chaperone